MIFLSVALGAEQNEEETSRNGNLGKECGKNRGIGGEGGGGESEEVHVGREEGSEQVGQSYCKPRKLASIIFSVFLTGPLLVSIKFSFIENTST